MGHERGRGKREGGGCPRLPPGNIRGEVGLEVSPELPDLTHAWRKGDTGGVGWRRGGGGVPPPGEPFRSLMHHAGLQCLPDGPLGSTDVEDREVAADARAHDARALAGECGSGALGSGQGGFAEGPGGAPAQRSRISSSTSRVNSADLAAWGTSRPGVCFFFIRRSGVEGGGALTDRRGTPGTEHRPFSNVDAHTDCTANVILDTCGELSRYLILRPVSV